jgi:hypothetical protein
MVDNANDADDKPVSRARRRPAPPFGKGATVALNPVYLDPSRRSRGRRGTVLAIRAVGRGWTARVRWEDGKIARVPANRLIGA